VRAKVFGLQSLCGQAAQMAFSPETSAPHSTPWPSNENLPAAPSAPRPVRIPKAFFRKDANRFKQVRPNRAGLGAADEALSPSAPKPSLTTKGELAVPNYPLIRSLRAEELAGNYEPMHCDYPVALMTRRTFALSADRILQSRSISPSPVDSGQSLRWSSRPPC
jgi:hypothetical protein